MAARASVSPSATLVGRGAISGAKGVPTALNRVIVLLVTARALAGVPSSAADENKEP